MHVWYVWFAFHLNRIFLRIFVYIHFAISVLTVDCWLHENVINTKRSRSIYIKWRILCKYLVNKQHINILSYYSERATYLKTYFLKCKVMNLLYFADICFSFDLFRLSFEVCQSVTKHLCMMTDAIASVDMLAICYTLSCYSIIPKQWFFLLHRTKEYLRVWMYER